MRNLCTEQRQGASTIPTHSWDLKSASWPPIFQPSVGMHLPPAAFGHGKAFWFFVFVPVTAETAMRAPVHENAAHNQERKQ